MKTINLGSEVMVSDPCYSVPTWCQHKLKDVLPGEYQTTAFKSDNTGGWGMRCAALVAVHNDYLEDDLSWRTVTTAMIGVDSGQCGIFDMESYRNDSIVDEITTPDVDFFLGYGDSEGDKWYEKMCKFTLCDDQWGSYNTGVVSSSGCGDGSYRLLVAKHKGKIVGIALDYLLFKLKSSDFNNIKTEEYV
jgi:hypothetical protein